MNLTWHIVKKDLRCLRWPLALWTLLIVAKLAAGVALLTAKGVMDQSWLLRMDALTKIFAGLECVSFVLVAALIHEDMLVGTTAFWVTRPISGARLLRAKFLGIGLIFGVLPVLVTLPWWLGCGYGLREIAWATTETLVVQAVFVLVGLLWAVVTDGFARFLMWTLVLFVAIPSVSATLGLYLTRVHKVVTPDLVLTRVILAVALAVAGILVVTVHQYLTRHTWRSIAIIGTTTALIIGVGAWWPWSWSIEARSYAFVARNWAADWPTTTEPAGLKFTVESVVFNRQIGSNPNRPFPLRLKYSVQGLAETQGLLAYAVDHNWRWADGSHEQVRGWGRSEFSQMVSDQALGLAMKHVADAPRTDTVATVAMVQPAVMARLEANPPDYTAKARLRVMRFTSATPVPLQPSGRSLVDGLGERIAGVEKQGEELQVTFVRHHPALMVDMGLDTPAQLFAQYVMVDQAREFADRGRPSREYTSRIGSVEISWQTIGYWASKKAGGPRPKIEAINALEGAELIKVSYEEQARFTHEFVIPHFTAEMVNP